MKQIVVIPNENGAYRLNGESVNIHSFPMTVTVSTKLPVFKAESVETFLEEQGKGTPISADTPSYEELIEAGFSTVEDLMNNDLTKVKGIGPVTAQKIINHITKGE